MEKYHERRAVKDVKGGDRNLFQVTISAFSRKKCEKSRKISVAVPETRQD